MNTQLTRIAVQSTGPDYNIQAEALWLGPDVMVCIWGGQAPHIGAVAMAQPRPSLADPGVMSSTASVFTYVGHKEDELAKTAAEAISAALNAKVVVSAGIHWDDLDSAAIKAIVNNSRQLVGLLIEKLAK